MATEGDVPKDSIEPKEHLIRVIRGMEYKFKPFKLHAYSMQNDFLKLKRITVTPKKEIQFLYCIKTFAKAFSDQDTDRWLFNSCTIVPRGYPALVVLLIVYTAVPLVMSMLWQE